MESKFSNTKYEVEKFDRLNYSLWRIKMRALLIQQGLLKALKGVSNLHVEMSDEDKEDLDARALSAI